MRGFVVYIDESGDEGFVFNSDGTGSSRWFVLSAAITRREEDLETVKLVDAVRAKLGRERPRSLHFRNLKHPQRVAYVDAIALAKIRTVSVLIHKPSIQEPEKFKSGHLYRYACRYLLERVSWFCRDFRREVGDGARLVFSNRSCMSYVALKDYLRLLKVMGSPATDVRIDWSVMDEDRFEVRTHDSLMGLQIADAVASSMWCGVEPHYGHTEPRYATMLKPTIYASAGKQLGHGFKLWPSDVRLAERPELAWIAETFR